jgi:hypothetical protein
VRGRLTEDSTSAAEAGLDMVSHAIGLRCVPRLTRTGTCGRRSRDRQTTDARPQGLTGMNWRARLIRIRVTKQARATS